MPWAGILPERAGSVGAQVAEDALAEAREAAAGDQAIVLVNQTPFYGESGGQMGDTGRIATATGGDIAVTDTQKKADGLFVHYGTVAGGTVGTGAAVELEVEQIKGRLHSKDECEAAHARRCHEVTISLLGLGQAVARHVEEACHRTPGRRTGAPQSPVRVGGLKLANPIRR